MFFRTKQSVVHSGFLYQIETSPLLKKTLMNSRKSDSSSSTGSSNKTDESESITIPLGVVIPVDESEVSVSHQPSSADSSIATHAIPIHGSGSSSHNSSSSSVLAVDKPWLSASYDPPSESSSPVVYGGYLTQSFMESFQRSHSSGGGFSASVGGVESGSNSGVNTNSLNAAVLRAKVLGKHLMHSNPGSATNASNNNSISSSAKDIALLLAESPSMLLLSASNGSSRAHTPGGYQRSRIRTLSETSKRAYESQDDLVSLGLAKSGSRDVMVSEGGQCGVSSNVSAESSEDVMNLLDIHASLLVN